MRQTVRCKIYLLPYARYRLYRDRATMIIRHTGAIGSSLHLPLKPWTEFSLGSARRLGERAWERRIDTSVSFLFRPGILRASASTYFNMYMIPRRESIFLS